MRFQELFRLGGPVTVVSRRQIPGT